MIRLHPGPRRGEMTVPVSKSHAHRVLIAEYLSGRRILLSEDPVDCDDIRATKRCLRALDAAHGSGGTVRLDCGESGTTRRLLGPVVAALGLKPEWVMAGRLANRPQIEYTTLEPGVQTLGGDVSSQFVSGLLLALPRLGGDSEIRLSSPLASRGYVAMTLAVLKEYGVDVVETGEGFRVPAPQTYHAPEKGPRLETDWSGAAFPLAMAALGNDVRLSAVSRGGLSPDSPQPDRAVVELLDRLSSSGRVELDVDECPDLFPVLAVIAAHRTDSTCFTGIRRLRLKESDRVAAMAEVLGRFGVACYVTEDAFEIPAGRPLFHGGAFSSFSDHRIAMAIAVGATVADAPVEIDDAACAAKSYPDFFDQFAALGNVL